ncbi:MAG TPA: hypothetical protein EYN71_05855 [Flavobacteriales bacterium]|nr:hypothetical protein [Flavobacteriales bacterium]HIO66793.1 hypothetical protein [Flavobacteriales bacterium]
MDETYSWMKKCRYSVHVGFLALFLLPLSATAQFMDDIQASMDKKPRIIFNVEPRKSFIDNSNVTVLGLKIVVEFDKRIRIGGGFNALTSGHSSNLDKVIYAENGIDTMDIAVLNFNYWCYFVEYVLICKPRWEISCPIQVGIGSSHYEYTGENNGLQELQKGAVILLETAVTGHYKIIKWAGIGVGVGYRFMLQNNKGLNQQFNSPIYIFTAKIFLGPIIESFSKKKGDTGDDSSAEPKILRTVRANEKG